MKLVKSLLPILLLLPAACGYRLAGRQGDTRTGGELGVPTFVNRTNIYRIEQRVSEVLRRELARNTGYRITSESGGDVIVAGEVMDYGQTPVVFNARGQATQYSVEIGVKLLVTDTRSGQVLLRNDRLPVREIFQLAQSPGDFVPEDTAAWDRIAGKLASSVVASLVHRAP
jgi:hypothetical protein